MKIQLAHSFENIVSVDNLLEAWKEFLPGKRGKKDVQEFSLNLMDNIFSLYNDLFNHTYKHGAYQAFNICDPKPRNIHKAAVRDRLLHHAIHASFIHFLPKYSLRTLILARSIKARTRRSIVFVTFLLLLAKIILAPAGF